MATKNKMTLRNEKGFALLAAIVASLILLAVGMLVINMATGDLLTTKMNVGNKKALAATESGIHRLIRNFNFDASTWTAANNYTTDCVSNPANPTYIWQSNPGGTDPNSRFAICAPLESNNKPCPDVPGTDIKDWTYHCYDVSVVGENTNYSGSRARIDIGVTYGPVPR
jgi:hypothetical protein